MTEPEYNFVQKMEVSLSGGWSLSIPMEPANDPNELVTFHLTLPRRELESLYWFDMEASREVEAKIEAQLIEQGFREERYRRYRNDQS